MIKGLTGVRAVGINDYPSRQEADNAPELEASILLFCAEVERQLGK